MHTQARSTTFFLLVLVVVFLAGCGGDGGGSGGGSGGTEDKQGGQAAQGNKNAPEAKMALGTVKRVNYEKERVVLKPTQGEGLMTFGVKPQAKVTLDDKKAELADVKKGQQAQIEYVQTKDLKRARSLQLFSAEEEKKE